MTSDVVIRVEGLGKKYVIGHETQRERYTALRDVIAQTARNAVRSAKSMLAGRALVAGDVMEEFWALKDVNFEVKRGDIVGIIGRNGAGKSTLLKILSRITEPTEGRVTLNGRVASLLEVGTGFHPELTGRENIYLNGAILGMKHAEIRRKFDEIVAFAEVERFLDTPVKRYSSGMYVRLAFAVAAHLEPEILIVDEVLAVGDAEFQKKCLGKMGEVAGHGRTVLFVSHNMQALQSLCHHAILIERGRVARQGEVREVLGRYLSDPSSATSDATQWLPVKAPGTAEARLIAVRLFDRPSKSSSWLSSTPPVVEFEFDVEHANPALHIGFDVLAADATTVFRSYHTDTNPDLQPRVRHGRNTLRCALPTGFFNTGSYFIAPRIGIHNQYWIAHLDPVLRFDIRADHSKSTWWAGGLNAGSRPGAAAPVARWSIAPGALISHLSGVDLAQTQA